jgi:alkylation response protein AidB-like acyl-CoA dehydrogenase
VNPLWLDRALGDPAEGDGPATFRSAVELDEREEFPVEAASRLDALGVPRQYVPRSLGGELQQFERLACVLRAMARRDLTLAIGHGKTILGSQPAFLGGDAATSAQVAARVLSGEPLALALTERENGSDLLSSRVHALDGARRLHGE